MRRDRLRIAFMAWPSVDIECETQSNLAHRQSVPSAPRHQTENSALRASNPVQLVTVVAVLGLRSQPPTFSTLRNLRRTANFSFAVGATSVWSLASPQGSSRSS